MPIGAVQRYKRLVLILYGTEVLKNGSLNPGEAKEYLVVGWNGLGVS